MEQDFSERLKQYRRGKNLTQQELADQLGVSNKTVSRWESAGGYPDAPLLVPLARTLGVTVDDLLDGEKPIRTLTTADWQNLLSFAFAIGGGVLFYLLKLFVPTVVCYLGYLGCLAYGTYLQRYYCYHSRWFLWGSGVMNFFVNLSLILSLGSIPIVLRWAQALYYTPYLHWPFLLGGAAALLLLSALLTAISVRLVALYSTGKKSAALPRLRLRRPSLRALVPALGILVLAGVFFFYRSDALRVSVTMQQKPIYYGILAGFCLLCILLSLKKGARKGLLTTAVMAAGGLLLPHFTTAYAWLPNSMKFIPVTPELSPSYFRFARADGSTLIAAGVLLALLLLVSCLRLETGDGGEESTKIFP